MKKINSQNLLAVSVLLVSITSVFVSIRQADIMKEQQETMHQDMEASLWPFIEISYTYNRGEKFEIIVENKGVGPAIVEGITVRDETQFLNSWNDVQRLMDEELSIKHGTDTLVSYGITNSGILNTVLTAGEERVIYGVYNGLMADALYAVYNHLEFKLCYRSVYESYWEYTRFYNGDRTVANTKEIDECATIEEQAFNDLMQL